MLMRSLVHLGIKDSLRHGEKEPSSLQSAPGNLESSSEITGPVKEVGPPHREERYWSGTSSNPLQSAAEGCRPCPFPAEVGQPAQSGQLQGSHPGGGSGKAEMGVLRFDVWARFWPVVKGLGRGSSCTASELQIKAGSIGRLWLACEAELWDLEPRHSIDCSWKQY